jgi:type II secretory pathway pseudopilin PulG
MTVNPLRSSAGFTYLMALMVILIMGIMLAAAGQSWKMIRDRELEEEFLFRGLQYKDAITRWYKPRPGQRPAPPLNDLKDLLKDPNSLTNIRYLRVLYPDPLTGKEWTTIRGGTTGGIIGIFSSYSSVGQKPIKQANFPTGLEDFEGKTRYSEWKFVYQQGTAAAGTGTSTTGVTTRGANTPGPATTTSPFTAR